MEIDRDEFDSVEGDTDTLAGLLLELNHEIPAKNEVIRFKNILFTIESADKRRIKRVKVYVEKVKEKDKE
jgi:CBS domain containing-hemolysin-like protein